MTAMHASKAVENYPPSRQDIFISLTIIAVEEHEAVPTAAVLRIESGES